MSVPTLAERLSVLCCPVRSFVRSLKDLGLSNYNDPDDIDSCHYCGYEFASGTDKIKRSGGYANELSWDHGRHQLWIEVCVAMDATEIDHWYAAIRDWQDVCNPVLIWTFPDGDEALLGAPTNEQMHTVWSKWLLLKAEEEVHRD